MRSTREEEKELPAEKQLEILEQRKKSRKNRNTLIKLCVVAILGIIVGIIIVNIPRSNGIAATGVIEDNVQVNFVDASPSPSLSPSPSPQVVEEVKEIDCETADGKVAEMLPKGLAVAYTKGEKGEKRIVKEISCDGEDRIISEDLIKRPSKVIVSRGTNTKRRVKEIMLSLFDFPKNFESGAITRCINARASAYIPGDIESCGKTDSISKSGVPLKYGAKGVSVDPKVIPLGSLLYVESKVKGLQDYGYGIAVDTGGDIKGNRIDVAIYDHKSKFCTKWDVKVYILDPNKIDFYKQ